MANLGRQLFPKHKNFLTEAYADATEKPYGWLLLDLHPATNANLRVHRALFPDMEPIVYIPKASKLSEVSQ